MKIGFCMPLNAVWRREVDRLKAALPEVEFEADMERAIAGIDAFDAIVANPLPRERLEAARALKALFVPFVGLNHLPADLLLGRGVSVFNCHGNAESVAERALAMTLDFFGRITEFHNDLARGRWHGFWVGKGAEDFWHSIYRRKALVLGTGAIGLELAKLLKAFGCDVTGYRRRSSLGAPAGFDRVVSDLDAALDAAELVFVTLPHTGETEGLLSKERLLRMKGKFLVNVGRAAVVDEEGLWLALKDGILAGAGIDVWYTYPQGGSTEGAPSRFAIHTLPNVILSPHVGGSTHEAVDINAAATVDNVIEWVRTGECRTRVDLKAAY
ncbi:MAG: NAD-binding protein [Spirochaetia bacterium]|nr:NAD-binding protein [Spirochaetia bacterium]